jgi:hypothetical protein
MPDLLPDDFGTETTLQPPVAILREQAEHLTRRTGGLVIGTVETVRSGNGLLHRFRLLVPTLDDYVYDLFVVEHGVFLYPLNINSGIPGVLDRRNLQSPEVFESALREFFSFAEVKRVVAALKAQATAVKA